MKELTEDQKDEGVRDYWAMAVEAAIHANLYFQNDLTQTAWDEKDVVTGAGRLAAVFDQDEYEWLETQYGKGILLQPSAHPNVKHSHIRRIHDSNGSPLRNYVYSYRA